MQPTTVSFPLPSPNQRDAPQGSARGSLFPLDLAVTHHASGDVASRYGDASWDLSSMSADGTSTITLNFYDGLGTSSEALALTIREQQKALMWLHMDAGKTRAPVTLRNSNFALTALARRAEHRGVELYALLIHPEWLAEDLRGLNQNYVLLTSALVQTLWRNRKQLGVQEGFGLQALKEAIQRESRGRPETQQTPLIPSRIYSAILSSLLYRMDEIELELDVLLRAYALSVAATVDSRCALGELEEDLVRMGYVPFGTSAVETFILRRIAKHQVALMLTVSAWTGMRVGEVGILPLEGVLAEFEHAGSRHCELSGFTHKLNRGVKRKASWVTSHQGVRAVHLAQRIAQAIGNSHSQAPRAGQSLLLFPSTENPYKTMTNSRFDKSLVALREELCPVLDQSDVDELDRLELARGWSRDDIEVGKRWPLAFHQLRRSLAVYAHRSGMVSLPALKAQLQHITQEMTWYYSHGFSKAVNLVFDKEHFSHEWNSAKAESSYFAFALGVLFSDDDLLGQGAERLSKVIEFRSRADTLLLFQEQKLAYRETPLGGCVATEPCKTEPLQPIPYDCLESNCVNLVVFSKRLDLLIRSQKTAVTTLERDEKGSIEHRLEARNLEVLLKASQRFKRDA